MGERSTATTRPGPRLVEGLSKDSGALKDIVPSLFPGPSSPPTGPGLSKLEGLQEKAWICLLAHFHLMTTVPPSLDSATSSVLPR